MAGPARSVLTSSRPAADTSAAARVAQLLALCARRRCPLMPVRSHPNQLYRHTHRLAGLAGQPIRLCQFVSVCALICCAHTGHIHMVSLAGTDGHQRKQRRLLFLPGLLWYAEIQVRIGRLKEILRKKWPNYSGQQRERERAQADEPRISQIGRM